MSPRHRKLSTLDTQTQQLDEGESAGHHLTGKSVHLDAGVSSQQDHEKIAPCRDCGT